MINGHDIFVDKHREDENVDAIKGDRIYRKKIA